jgi:hypothetical protein
MDVLIVDVDAGVPDASKVAMTVPGKSVALPRHIARPPAPPSRLVPAIPDAIDRIVTRLLAKMAEDRHQTAPRGEGLNEGAIRRAPKAIANREPSSWRA